MLLELSNVTTYTSFPSILFDTALLSPSLPTFTVKAPKWSLSLSIIIHQKSSIRNHFDCDTIFLPLLSKSHCKLLILVWDVPRCLISYFYCPRWQIMVQVIRIDHDLRCIQTHAYYMFASNTIFYFSLDVVSFFFFRVSSGSYAIFLCSMDPFHCENKYFFSSDLYFHGNSYERCLSTRASVSLWSSSAHYVTLQVGTSKKFGKFVASKHLVKKRQVIANLH